MLTRRGMLAGGGALGAALLTGASRAQPLSRALFPVVVLDRDLLYAQSAFGQRILADLEAAGQALIQENRRIEAALEAEEQSLTDLRASTDPDSFAQMATEFDSRVETIRRAQNAKTRNLNTARERAEAVFFETSAPILEQVAREFGALVVLDRRSVLAAADQVDITADALARINEAVGEGPGLAGILDMAAAGQTQTDDPEATDPADP